MHLSQCECPLHGLLREVSCGDSPAPTAECNLCRWLMQPLDLQGLRVYIAACKKANRPELLDQLRAARGRLFTVDVLSRSSAVGHSSSSSSDPFPQFSDSNKKAFRAWLEACFDVVKDDPLYSALTARAVLRHAHRDRIAAAEHRLAELSAPYEEDLRGLQHIERLCTVCAHSSADMAHVEAKFERFLLINGRRWFNEYDRIRKELTSYLDSIGMAEADRLVEQHHIAYQKKVLEFGTNLETSRDTVSLIRALLPDTPQLTNISSPLLSVNGAATCQRSSADEAMDKEYVLCLRFVADQLFLGAKAEFDFVACCGGQVTHVLEVKSTCGCLPEDIPKMKNGLMLLEKFLVERRRRQPDDGIPVHAAPARCWHAEFADRSLHLDGVSSSPPVQWMYVAEGPTGRSQLGVSNAERRKLLWMLADDHRMGSIRRGSDIPDDLVSDLFDQLPSILQMSAEERLATVEEIKDHIVFYLEEEY